MKDNKLNSKERIERLWDLYDRVLASLIENFTNPELTPSAFLISCAINFLKMNGIKADSRPGQSNIEKGLEALYDLPFDTEGNPMSKKLRTQ